jgi:hypothetical protein
MLCTYLLQPGQDYGQAYPVAGIKLVIAGIDGLLQLMVHASLPCPMHSTGPDMIANQPGLADTVA